MRIISKVAALAAAAALPLAMASTASAAPAAYHPMLRAAPSLRPAAAGERDYAEGETGYIAYGAQFRFAAQSSYLRDPAQYAAVTDGLDEGVILQSADWQFNISLFAATSPADTVYNPQFYVSQGSTTVSGPYGDATWCPAGGTCAPLGAGDGFAVGDTVRLSLYYDQKAGTVAFTATDAAGNLASESYDVGKGQSFGLAFLGSGWGAFTAPATATRLSAFSGAGLTTYSGGHSGLSSWFGHSKVIGTSDGTSTGTVQGTPSDLASKGSAFSVSLQPAS